MTLPNSNFPRGIAVMMNPNSLDAHGDYVAKRLGEALPKAEIFLGSEPSHIADFTSVETLISPVRPWIPDIVRQAKALKWIHLLSSGVDNLWDLKFNKEHYLISKSAGVHAVPMAEYVIGCILYFLKDFHVFKQRQRQRLWKRHWLKEARGQTAAVVGLGNIGLEVARRCKAMGMRVLGLARTPRNHESVDSVYSYSDLPLMLSEADFVIVALPLTPDTRDFLSAERLNQVKPGAFLINVSRGSIVNEGALLELLQTGTLAGAALDVFDEEPLSPASPLWDVDNVLITPHVSGTTPLYMERALDVFIDNLESLQKTGRLVTGVDFEAKY